MCRRVCGTDAAAGQSAGDVQSAGHGHGASADEILARFDQQFRHDLLT